MPLGKIFILVPEFFNKNVHSIAAALVMAFKL
jgi:hypothetical protein